VIGPTKAGKPRVVDLDERTVAVLRAQRAARAELSLDLARAMRSSSAVSTARCAIRSASSADSRAR
jgi:hypothetical protein